MSSLNVIELIEKSPITRLNKEYEHRFIEKVKENFSENEQQIFLSSFFMYINYDQNKDFVVDFEFVWKWCGFTRKDSGKKLLEKHFTKDIDFIFKNFAPPYSGKPIEYINNTENYTQNNLGGRPSEYIYLTVNTFKKFCLKAGTKKADEIHNYYIKLENIIQETLDEETQELREQLMKKDEALMDKIEQYNKLQENHNRILYKRKKHQMMKGRCLYIIKHNDVNTKYKFGITFDLNSRASSYRTYNITDFQYIVYTEDNKLIEDCISRKFKNYLVRYDSEWICNIELNDIIKFIDDVIDLLEIDAKKYTNMDEIIVKDEENVQSYNDGLDLQNNKNIEINQINESIIEDTENKSYENLMNEFQEINKKCNKCLLVLPKTSFNKDKSKKDGHHNTCRLCEKETKKQYMLKKQETMKQITEKQCKICNIVKDVTNFSKHLYCKDGYVAHCHDCIQKNSNNKRKLDRENNIRYRCGRCGADYSRKDVLIKHQKNCMI